MNRVTARYAEQQVARLALLRFQREALESVAS
jgi:hypothetical protein